MQFRCGKAVCIEKNCGEEKLQVIFSECGVYENGVHGDVKRNDFNTPEDAFVIGMVGRMSPQKVPDIFVKMVKLVKEEILNAHLIIVSNGKKEAEIRKNAEDNGFPDSLHITGWF